MVMGHRLFSTFVCALPLAAGCSPEVVIARDSPVVENGGSAGSDATAGTGGELSGSGGTGEGGTTAEEPRILADSIADFSFTQGELGWQYGVDNGSLDSFTQMTRKAMISNYMPPTNDVWECWRSADTHWAQIFRLGAHPNGTATSSPSQPILERAVRRWTSTYAGDVVITGEVAKIDIVVPTANGVDASVYVDGTSLFTQFIEPDDSGGSMFRLDATLHVGSTVDLVLDPHEGDDHHDLTRFSAVITRATPTP